MTDLISRIKAALEGVTPGPWEKVRADDDEEWLVRYPNGEDVSLLLLELEPDADFIANARTLLPEALEEASVNQSIHDAATDAWVATVTKLIDERDALNTARQDLMVDRDRIRAERDRLRDALATCSDAEYPRDVARKALAQLDAITPPSVASPHTRSPT